MKKIVLLLFLVLTMVVTMVACTKDKDQPPATQPGEQTTAPPATAPAVTYTVTFSDGVAAATVREGETVEEPDTPARIGYRFVGWYVGSDPYDFDAPVTADLSLTARWAAVSYTITYHPDGGEAVAANPVSYTVEDTITLHPAQKTGFDFDGWYDAAGNKVTSIPAGTTGDLDLYARWSALPIFSLDFEGAQSTTDGDIAIHYADSSLTYNGFTYTKATPATGGYIEPFCNPLVHSTIYAMFFKNYHNFHYIVHEEGRGDFFRIELDSTKTTYDTYSTTAGEPSEHYNTNISFCIPQFEDESFDVSFDFRYDETAQFPVTIYLRGDGTGKQTKRSQDRCVLATLMPNGDVDIGTDAIANLNRLTYKDGSAYVTTSTVLANAALGEWHTITFHFEINEDDATSYYIQIRLDGRCISGAEDDYLTLEAGDVKFETGGANRIMIFGGGGNCNTVNQMIADGTLEDFKCNYDFDNFKIIPCD